MVGIQARDSKGRILSKEKQEPETETQSHDKFEAFHQPEVVGIRDIETDEVIVLKQATTLTDHVGDAIFKARELTLLDRTAKSVA